MTDELAVQLRLRRGPHRSMQDKIDQIAAADRIEELNADNERLRAAMRLHRERAMAMEAMSSDDVTLRAALGEDR